MPQQGTLLQVTLLDDIIYPDYRIRKLQIINVSLSIILCIWCTHVMVRQTSGDNEEAPLTLLQYHYLGWPDYGVPKPSSLLNFILHVRRSRSARYPILVHCSAGTGRTGVYIALNSMLDCIEQAQSINVYNFVQEMCRRRIGLMQTEVCVTIIVRCA